VKRRPSIPKTDAVPAVAPSRLARAWPSWAALAVAAIVLLRSGFPSSATRYGYDDAYVTYRYARNLAHGLGFVFNPGQPAVLGTSTPLYALILALGARLGAPIPALSIVLGTLATAVTLALLVRLAARMGRPAAGVAAALVWSLSPFSYRYVEGMETPLYMALIVGALWAALEGRRSLPLTLGALAALTRPDGLAVPAVVAGLVLIERRWSWRAALPAAVLLLAWIAWATARFGSPIPVSGLAKGALPDAISGRFSLASSQFLELLWPLLGLAGVRWLPAAPVVLALALAACLLALRPARGPRLVAAWIALYFAGLSVLRLPDFSWYYAPMALPLALLFWMGVESLIGRGRPAWAEPVTLLAGLLVGGLTLLLPVPIGFFDTRPAQLEAGAWLKEHAAPGSTLAAYEIGMVSYASGLTTIDLLGLTEPAAQPHLARGDYAWAIRERRPTYVFTNQPSAWPVTAAIFALPGFLEDYELAARFPFRPDTDYLLLRRRAP
jgi:hypothetical protein